ncbi:MAG: nitroreductase/quinone reductase family protein [Dehalococcoidia bacterium]|nr:nitroreductase/quinone reductase family protein [Dehalococcoidia bacterium]
MTFYRKPTRLTQMMNGALVWLASLGLTPSRMITLEVKGRRSGETRSTVMNIVEYEGENYVVSPRGESEWVRNLRAAGGEATIRHRGRRSVQLEEVPAEQRAPVLKKYLGENAMSTKQHFGIDPKAGIAEFAAIAERYPAFRVIEGG